MPPYPPGWDPPWNSFRAVAWPLVREQVQHRTACYAPEPLQASCQLGPRVAVAAADPVSGPIVAENRPVSCRPLLIDEPPRLQQIAGAKSTDHAALASINILYARAPVRCTANSCCTSRCFRNGACRYQRDTALPLARAIKLHGRSVRDSLRGRPGHRRALG